MRGVRGANKQPGEIRRSQNWIGGTRPGNAAFVRAPPEELTALLADLEKYLHTKNGLPSIIRIGLAHVRFETIHPYLDGNGRIGRLLITLLLEHWKLLSAPLEADRWQGRPAPGEIRRVRRDLWQTARPHFCIRQLS
jgi:Fic family protein